MSAAAAAPEAAPPKKGSKKLILIGGVVLLLVIVGVVAALMLGKKKHADEEGADGEAAAEKHAPAPKAVAKRDPKTPPTFVPLDPFTVNLADRDAERYAQVGITLEMDDPKLADQIKVYMPAIRNNILLALADKTAGQLMERGGKAKLADQVRRETARGMGYDVEEPDDEEEGGAEAAKDAKPKKKKKKKAEAPLPITAVHFSNFIIQ